MVLNFEREMRIACEEWLRVREHFMSRSGAEFLDEYRLASERLFAAFVSDFQIEDFAVLSWAFRNFRGCLVKSVANNRAYPAWSPANGLRKKN